MRLIDRWFGSVNRCHGLQVSGLAFYSFRVIFGYYCESRLVDGMCAAVNDVSHVVVRSVAIRYRHYRRMGVIGSFYRKKAPL